MPVTSAVSTGKKTKGRKRHIVIDTLGGLLGVVVHKANLNDTTMGLWPAIFATESYPSIKRFCADRGYRATFVQDAHALIHRGVNISECIKSGKRWVVERTFSWINNSRRLSKEHAKELLSNLWRESPRFLRKGK